MEYNLTGDVLLRKITIIFILITVLGCSNIKEKQVISFLALNTTCTITVLNSQVIDMEQIKKIVVNIENLMSTHILDSDISKINRLAGMDFYTPDFRTLEVIKKGIEFGELSNGGFDISIGPLVKLWNINNQSRIISESEIDPVLNLINYKNIIIKDNSVKLLNKGMSLDLGGIAKGYASNIVKEYLISSGVTSAIINLGGNIDLVGNKPGGFPWRVGIQHPRNVRGEYIGILGLTGKSFVSSGDYERFFEVDGIRYHHILSSKTGYPKRGEIISSSILSDSSFNGDALSTITFGLSISEVKELRKKINFEGVFITEDRSIYLTEGIKKIFTLKDESYNIVP